MGSSLASCRRAHASRIVVAIAGVASLTSAAQGQTTWNNAGTSWNSAANWNNGVPPAAGNATFVGTPITQPNLVGSATVGSIDFQSGGWTFSGSRLAMNTSGGGMVSTGSPTGDVTFNNNLGMGANAVWSNSVNVTVNGLVDTGGGASATRSFTLNGSGLVTLAGGYALIGSGATIPTPFLRTVTIDGTGSINISSTISDGLTSGLTGALRFSTTGLVTLTGANTYSGGTLYNTSGGGGTIAFDADESFGAVPGALSNNNIQILQNGTLRFVDGSGNATIHANRGIMIGGSSARTLTLDVPGATDTLTLNGPISETAATFGRLAKTGAGTLVLNAASTHSASSNFSAGTVVLNHNSSVGTGSLVMSGGVAILSKNGPRVLGNEIQVSGAHNIAGAELFTFNGQALHRGTTDRTITISNSAGVTYANIVQLTNGTNLGDRSWTFQGTGATLTFSSTIGNGPGGTGSVNFNKSGVTILNGNNTYTGPTSITNGTVFVNGTHSPAGAYTVNSGTLAGGGNIGSSVTVKSGARLAPGSSIGTLTANSLDLQGGAELVVDVNFNEFAASSADKFIAADTAASVTLGDGVTLPKLKFVASYVGEPGNTHSLVLIQNDNTSDTTTGEFEGLAQAAVVTDGMLKYAINYNGGDGNDVVVDFIEVPEPSASAIVLAALVAARRRRSTN